MKNKYYEGTALPIEALAKYTDVDSLQDGDRIFILNGHRLCRLYIPPEMEIDVKKKTLVRCRCKKGREPSIL